MFPMPEAKDSLNLPVEKQMAERREELEATATSRLQEKVWGKVRQLARFGVPAITLVSAIASACSDAEQKIVTPTPDVHQPTASRTATGLPSVTETPLLEPTVTPTPLIETEQKQSIFETLRQRVDSLEPVKRQEAIAQIEDFEKVDQGISQFEAAYQAQKEPDGTPTLLALIKQKYQHLDLTLLVKGQYPSVDTFLEAYYLFWKGDKITLDTNLKMIIESNSPPEEIAKDIKNIHDNFLIGLHKDFYLALQPNWAVTTELPPETDPQIVQALQEAVSEFPLIGQVKIKFGQQESWEPTGGVLTQEGNVSVIVLTPQVLGDDPKLYKQVLYHEGSHIDPADNLGTLPYYLTPEQFINLYIQRMAALADPQVGRNYPDIDKILRSDRVRTEREAPQNPLSAQEFADRSSLAADAIWIAQTKEWLGPLTTPIFDQRFLTTDLTDTFAKEYQSRGLEVHASVRDLTEEELVWLNQHQYETTAEFLEKESAKLDQIATSSPVWKIVIDTLRENPQRFEGFRWLDGLPPLAPIPIDNLPSTWFTRLSTFGNLILLEGFFENDPQVVELFTPNEKREILGKIIALLEVCDREKWADSLVMTFVSQSTSFAQDKNPFQSYLETAAQIKSEAKAHNPE